MVDGAIKFIEELLETKLYEFEKRNIEDLYEKIENGLNGDNFFYVFSRKNGKDRASIIYSLAIQYYQWIAIGLDV